MLSYYTVKMLLKKWKKWIGLVIVSICFFVSFFYTVFAVDVVHEQFSPQTATSSGSNNSIISVNENLEYVNKGNDSSVVWNYFQWYYYDSMLWFFRTDWSTNPNQNVRVTSSTSRCPVGYWYRLWWYAYSSTFWFIDFDYNSDIFTYYCVQDKRLYWYAYSSSAGFQNFSGITFEIETNSNNIANISGTGYFTNDGSQLTTAPVAPGNETAPKWESVNSNFTSNTIQFDKIEFESLQESLFYIIK